MKTQQEYIDLLISGMRVEVSDDSGGSPEMDEPELSDVVSSLIDGATSLDELKNLLVVLLEGGIFKIDEHAVQNL